MRTLLISAIAAGFVTSTAFAAPMELTEDQLDQVAAGAYEDGNQYRGYEPAYGEHPGQYQRNGASYFPYYYNYNDNYNDNDNFNNNDNDNYNYNENNNYIYISIPFYGYGGQGGGY